MTTWDPQQYQRFQKERAQPFFDLLSRIPDGEVTTAADLGCGPGTLTATLTERWPHASVWGVDNSPQMLATARAQPAQTRSAFCGIGYCRVAATAVAGPHHIERGSALGTRASDHFTATGQPADSIRRAGGADAEQSCRGRPPDFA